MKRTILEQESSVTKKITKLVAVSVFILILLSVSRGIFRLSASKGRVEEAQMKLEEVQNLQRQLSGELEMVKSDYYQEKQTRDKLGLAKEDEIVFVLPDESVLRKLSPRKQEESVEEEATPNWKKWAKLFFEI